MYRLTVDGVEHYVVAIRNVFSNHLTTHKKFDLKGSTVDREASDKEKEKDLPTYKDNDFVKEGMKIYIGEEAKAKLIETLTADVDVSITYERIIFDRRILYYHGSYFKSYLELFFEIKIGFESARSNLSFVSIVLDEITLDGLLFAARPA